MATVKTLSKGQIVIPAAIRKRYQIESLFRVQFGIAFLLPPVSQFAPLLMF